MAEQHTMQIADAMNWSNSLPYAIFPYVRINAKSVKYNQLHSYLLF